MPSLYRYMAFVVAGYATVTGAMFLGQRRLMYHPGPPPPPPAEVGLPEMAPVTLETTDGLALLAWHAPARAGRATVVVFHGNAGNLAHRAPKARALIDAGYGVLLVAWRGFGGNPGAPSEDGLYEDGRAAFRFLAGRGVAPARIVVYGESLGSGVAVQMATEYGIAAIILEAPFTSIVDVAARHYWYMPARWLLLDRFDSEAKIGAVAAPILVLHGLRDAVVPADLGRALFAAAPEPKVERLFEDGGHSDLYEHGAGEAVVAFLADAVP